MRKYKNNSMYLVLAVLVFLIGVGYAVLSANLSITGIGSITNSTWNVHFNDPTVTPGSVTVDTTQGQKAATKDDATTVSYNVLLSKPGDYYEFTVPVQNEGSIDAMVDTVSSTIQIGTGTVTTINSSADLPVWLNYSVTYVDGTAIATKHKLDHGTTETYKVRVEFKRDITNGQFESAVNNELHFTFGVGYVQKDNTAIDVPHPAVSFANDSWDIIVAAVKAGYTNGISVGDTKTVDMGTLGIHTLRVANNSTPAECSTAGFSQTACGFVLEFADVITTHIMNPSGSANGNGNIGGWEYSDMRAYLNSSKYLEGTENEVDYTNDGIYNALPPTLKNAIINTTVVSGYSLNDSSNYTTTDKIYLLSTHEVWDDDDNDEYSGISYHDKGYSNTRQLDYYHNNNVTTTNYAGAIKQYDSTDYWLWLRSAYSGDATGFFGVYNYGEFWYSYSSDSAEGVSPAFRIA